MAAGAILRKQKIKILYIVRVDRNVTGRRPSRQSAATRRNEKSNLEQHPDPVPFPHGFRSSCFLCAITPGVSIPARTEKGMICLTGTRCWRTTISPATIPKANWDAMNHHQFTYLLKSGLIKSSMLRSSPDQRIG